MRASYGRAVVAVAFIAAAALTACAGGTSAVWGLSAPGGRNTSGRVTAKVSFRLVLNRAPAGTSATKRGALYLSPATQSATIVATQSGAQVASAVANCSATACAITFAAPVGPATFAVNALSGPNGTGNVLSTGTVEETIDPNVVNLLSVTLDGVVSSVQIVPQPGFVQASGSFQMRVNAFDASGNQIIAPGAYASPVAVMVAARNATVTSNTVSISNDAPVTVTVQASNVGAAASLVLTPQGVSGTPAAVQIVPTPVPSVSPSSNPNNDVEFNTAADLAKLPKARPVVTTPLPVSVTLQGVPEINQGELNSCASASFAEIMTYLVGQQRGWQPVPPIGATPPPDQYLGQLLSPAFVFNALNDYTTNTGSALTDVVAFASANGIATWQQMPYQILSGATPEQISAAIAVQPSPAAVQAALGFRTLGLENVDPSDIQTIKATLANGSPLWIVTDVDDNFGSLNASNNLWSNVLPLVGQPGGHALVIFGYNDNAPNPDGSTGQLFGLNTWGTGFGVNGVFRISYNDFPKVIYQVVVVEAQFGAAVSPLPSPAASIPGPTGSPWPAPASTPVMTVATPSYANAITFNGSVQIPAGTGSQAQVNARFFYTNTSGFYAPVPAATSGPYNDGFGNAIGTTAITTVNPYQSTTLPFTIAVPFTAFAVQQNSFNTMGAQLTFFSDSVPVGAVADECFNLVGGSSATAVACPSPTPAPTATPG